MNCIFLTQVKNFNCWLDRETEEQRVRGEKRQRLPREYPDSSREHRANTPDGLRIRLFLWINEEDYSTHAFRQRLHTDASPGL